MALKSIDVGNGVKCEVDDVILTGITKEFSNQKIVCDGGKLSPQEALKSFVKTLHEKFPSYKKFIFGHAPAELRSSGDKSVLTLNTITEDEDVYKSKIRVFNTDNETNTIAFHVDEGLPFLPDDTEQKNKLRNWFNKPTY